MPTYKVTVPNGKEFTLESSTVLNDDQVWAAVVAKHPDALATNSTKELTYQIVAHNGKTYEVNAPRGATQEQIARLVLQSHPEANLASPQGQKKPDLSKMSDGDLKALAAGNVKGMSTEGLKIVAGVTDESGTNKSVVPASTTAAPTTSTAIVPASSQVAKENWPTEYVTGLLVGVAILVIVGPMWLARVLNRKHLAKRPKCMPFAWGYYIALASLFAPFFIAGAMRSNGLDLTSLRILITVLLLFYVPLAILTLRRNKLGFILLTVLQLNPVYWVINSVYIKNRWRELTPSFAGSHRSNDHFAQALSEIENGNQDRGLWARCFAEANGDEPKAKAAYIKQRATAVSNNA